MLAEWFYWLLSMSIVGAITGAVVLLVRCISCIPRRVTVWLWALPLCRLVIPFGVGGRFGLMALLSHFFSKTVVLWTGEHVSVSAMNLVQAAESYFPISYKSPWLVTLFQVASTVWISVASALLILLSVQYVQTVRAVRKGEPFAGNVVFCVGIDTPFVCGVFRPRIALPTAYKTKDRRFVLLHEQLHIRRRDNLWRMIAFVTAAVHWLNPLVWIYLKCFLTDLELACDESVLRACGEEQKREYAAALVDAAETRLTLMSALGGAPLRTRVNRILSYRKLTLLSVVGCLVLIVSMAYGLLTNAA